MTTTFTPATTLPSLSVLFTARSEFVADIVLRSHGALGVITTVIYEHINGVADFILIGDASLDLSVQDGESLTIMARCQGTIIGAGIFEVDTSLVETLGVLLIPRATSNIVVDQCQASTVQNGINTALERCKRRYTTDALPAESETAVAQ